MIGIESGYDIGELNLNFVFQKVLEPFYDTEHIMININRGKMKLACKISKRRRLGIIAGCLSETLCQSHLSLFV